ncbi:hypothetical protein PMAYCL1PPCAC_29631, partial [Pristionchus mayeri]
KEHSTSIVSLIMTPSATITIIEPIHTIFREARNTGATALYCSPAKGLDEPLARLSSRSSVNGRMVEGTSGGAGTGTTSAILWMSVRAAHSVALCTVFAGRSTHTTTQKMLVGTRVTSAHSVVLARPMKEETRRTIGTVRETSERDGVEEPRSTVEGRT